MADEVGICAGDHKHRTTYAGVCAKKNGPNGVFCMIRRTRPHIQENGSKSFQERDTIIEDWSLQAVSNFVKHTLTIAQND
jgi:hypothetical protein